MVRFPLEYSWKNRSILYQLAIMNISIRYKATYLGIIWTALEPLLTFILLYVVFNTIRDRPQENFAIYLLTGIILYHIFTRGTMAGLTSLSGNSNIINSLNVNREIFPVTAVISTAILMMVHIVLFFGLMPFFQYTPPITIIFLPLVLALLVILILGFSFVLSIINVFVRDIQVLWTVIIHAMFFVTPIIWYLDEVDVRGRGGFGDILLTIHSVNPIGQLIELAHNLVIFGKIPSINDWLYVSFLCIGIFILGFLIFNKYQSRIAEEI